MTRWWWRWRWLLLWWYGSSPTSLLFSDTVRFSCIERVPVLIDRCSGLNENTDGVSRHFSRRRGRRKGMGGHTLLAEICPGSHHTKRNLWSPYSMKPGVTPKRWPPLSPCWASDDGGRRVAGSGHRCCCKRKKNFKMGLEDSGKQKFKCQFSLINRINLPLNFSGVQEKFIHKENI